MICFPSCQIYFPQGSDDLFIHTYINYHNYYFQSYEEELSKFAQQVNEGRFIDPSGNPLLLLEELKQILEEAYSVRSRLLGLSKWKEAISGKPHDLSRVFRYIQCIREICRKFVPLSLSKIYFFVS